MRQELIFLCKDSTKRFVNCFIIFFVGISLSWAAFFMSSRFISFEISSTVTHMKEKLALFAKFLHDFINNRNTMIFLVFLKSLFNWIRNARNIAEVELVDFDSKIWYYIDKSIKTNCFFYSLLIDRSFSLGVI